MKNAYEVIKRPVISEKSTALSEVGGRYVFEVAPQANKDQIRDAVEKLFKVDVTAVRTMMVHGKMKRRTKSMVKKTNWKKAIVTLREGQKIELFQNA